MDQHITATASRLVGNPVPGWWAQTFVYDPPFPDQRASRGTLYAVLDVSGSTMFDAAACGKALINKLQESYYVGTEGGVLVALEGALQESWQALSEHLKERQVDQEIEVNIAAAVRWGAYWYVAASGTARVALFRDGTLETIVIGRRPNGEAGTLFVESASGVVTHGDCLIVATNAFCRFISAQELTALLAGTPEDAVDALAPRVHGEEGTARVAGILVHVTIFSVPVPDEDGITFTNKDAPASLSLGGPKLKNFWSFLLRKPTPARERPLYVGSDEPRRFPWAILIGIGSMFLLVGSIVFFKPSWPSGSNRLSSQEQETLTQVQQRVEEAKALADLNVTRSRTLLNEAKAELERFSAEQKQDAQIKELLVEIEEALTATSRSYSKEPEEYYSFALLAEGATVTDATFDEVTLVGVNRDTKAVYQVDVAKKGAQVIAGGDSGPAQSDWIVSTAGRVYAVSGSTGIYMVGQRGTSEAAKADGWSRVVDAEGYGGNVYVLDVGNKQIWKYVPVSGGLSTARRYIAGDADELSEAVSFAIDGNVWVLTRQGEVFKYLNGSREQFSVKGLEQPLSSPTRIFTSEQSKLLYILDYGNQRVVVFTKDGTFHSEYRTGKVAQAISLYGNEQHGRLLLVTKESLLSIPLIL